MLLDKNINKVVCEYRQSSKMVYSNYFNFVSDLCIKWSGKRHGPILLYDNTKPNFYKYFELFNLT